jgi:TonB-dependent receptor
MLDLPLAGGLEVIGGFRSEKTRIGIVNDAEKDATWYPPGSVAPTMLNPGDADVSFESDKVLPSIALVFAPVEQFTLRAAFNKTVARQTFKELSPILQQEFLGGPIFIGNPELQMSNLRNYDLRLDYRPYQGGLWSASYFLKKIDQPIEYVQRLASFDYTTAANYPEGELSGIEIEMRQALGQLWQPLTGIGIGANATLIDSEVTLDAEEAVGFDLPNIRAPMSTRDMTNAPEHLYNFYLTYDAPESGTQIGLFYTIQGDTLIAGAGQSNGNFVPSIYAKEFGTLNLTLSQRLGEHVKLEFRAKNLTDPAIDTVYRSPYIGDDVIRSSHTRGIDYSLILGSEIRF